MAKETTRRSRGFTLTEMLVTVAIVIVLFALAMIPITKMQRDMRQTELDSRAEMLFMAAQNRLTQLQAAGRSGAYQAGAVPLGCIPVDAIAEQYKEENNLCYVKSDAKGTPGSAAANIMPEDKTDAELWNANWVIEYDKVSGSVYAVFYSQKPLSDYSPNGDFGSLRYRKNRLNAGAKVGYYGGDSVGSNKTGELNPTIELINAEQLAVKITCEMPGDKPLRFFVTVADEDGHKTDEIELINGIDSVKQDYRTFTAEMLLDDLTVGKGMRFCEQPRFYGLVPGEDLTITVRVSASDPLIEDSLDIVKANSLFARVEDNGNGRTATIEYARHLQNLDKDSGVEKLSSIMSGNKTVTAAVQAQDIQFKETGKSENQSIRSWYDLYGARTFQPIRNKDLTSYRSSMYSGDQEYHPSIYDLTVQADGDAGLFESFSGGTLSNIRLAGAQIAGTGNVGALAGSVSGKVTIEGCRVFLSEAKGHLSGKHETDLWLTGKTTGGLIGAAKSSGKITISESFAATVLSGTNAAGGLIGDSKADVTMEKSYADCYVYSENSAGGLIGTRQGTSTTTMTDCYAAGFLQANVTGGLVADELAGSVNVLTNVYSACAALDGGSLTYTTAKKDGVNPPRATNVYYLSETANAADMIGQHASFEDWSGANLKKAAETLGAAFTDKTSDTNAYNLIEGMGLKNYSYPKLDGIPHYGDWQAKFESGALAYYEAYLSGNYGFYGANVSTLSNDGTVLGDGYGLIYAGDAPDEVTVTDGTNEHTFKKADAVSITVTDKDGKETVYSLLKLPKEFVQSVTDVPEHFYRELKADGRSYYYNPHFASTVVAEMSEEPESISVRTARQLNTLSLYYDDYAKILPKGAAFLQGRGIDYAAYDWETYGLNGECVSSQTPIGQTDAGAFTHAYDGGRYPITGVSFVSGKDGVYAGMFGRSDGTLRGVVLTTNEPMDTAPTVATSGVVQLRSVYLGTLAGWNYGTVSNCAVSGYVIEGRAYSASTVYAGALVGYNSGTIRASSAVSPIIDEKSTDAYLYVGGFAGGNSGQIRQSYAMGNIEIMEISGGATTLAGFAGENYGTIRDSYCATALSSAGGTTYGFAPNSGGVSGCYYLDNGTYSFAGGVHLYDYEPGAKGAKGVTDEELAKLPLDGFGEVNEAHTHNYPNTEIKEDEAAYPYLSSVSGLDGQPTHYGDWVTKADMGTVGVVYWEYEGGGSNAGYHFSFVGFESGIEKTGSSLCTAHDDGGAVTRYGYGYYYKDGEAEAELKAAVKDGDRNDAFVLGDRVEEIEQELAKQVPGFTFVAYETADKGLHLESSNAANGYWTLSQQSKDKPNETLSYKFELCPFFGNAYTVVENSAAGTAGDDNTKTLELGKDSLPYEVRSLAQLQYINWSYARSAGTSGIKGGTTTNVTSSTYKFFPYLQYTTENGAGKQTRKAAEDKHPARSWQQMHDLTGTAGKNFQPIAGAVQHITKDSYSMMLYTWFGGKYDGQSYYIKNITIDSPCYNVGLFGATAGATIQNIVLYSDNSSVIQRNTSASSWDRQYNGTPQDVKEYICSYTLGGLIGVAYEYNGEKTGEIRNCAIAGYVIADNSKNALQLGEATVGGLIGVSNANLSNCSAVVDIKINCTHRWKEDSSLNSAKWGNFVRVGGLVGGLRDTATNCYTGGSIAVSQDTLIERVKAGDDTNLNLQALDSTERIKWSQTRGGNKNNGIGSYNANLNPATYIYVGGVGGSGFSANFMNFTGSDSGSSDGNPKFVNCYTYITLPKMEGTITGICLIGSVADRFNYADASITNCYYLQSTKDSIDFSNVSRCVNPSGYSLSSQLDTKEKQEAMLNGDLTYLKNYMWEVGARKAGLDGLTGLTYAQMASRNGGADIKKTNIDQKRPDNRVYDTFKDALGSGFHWVTTDEDGASIHGKYSFPGSDAALLGQNYPFPTVLTQKSDFGTVYLHYGSWPKVGLYWSEGIASLDLIADYDRNSGTSYLPLELLIENVDGGLSGEPVFSYTTEGIVEATATRNAQGNFDVKLKGLKLGATEVTATLGGYTARMTVTVTADLIVTAEPGVIEKYAGEETLVTLSAKDQKGNEVPDVSWDIISSESGIVSFTKPVTAAAGTTSTTTTTVKNLDEGETNLMIYAIWKLDGKEYRGSTVLAVTTLKSNVLGVASGGSYCEGMLNQTLTGWAEDKQPRTVEYGTDAPSCEGSTLFLYSRGAGIDLSRFTVKSIAAGTTDALSGTGDYTAVPGQVQKNGEYTCLPIALYGKTESTTLTITLTDENGSEYCFTDIPAKAQTSVTATFEYPAGTTVLTKNVTYGTIPSINTTDTDNVSSLEPPEGYRFRGELTDLNSWTPTIGITAGLRRPTVFTPILVGNNATDAK